MSTVLVVEDDEALRGALRASLHARRSQVLEAGTGEEALQIAAREDPDLVLLDLGLPGIDGTQVLRTLREWGETPVVVLTVRDTQAEKSWRSTPARPTTSRSRSTPRSCWPGSGRRCAPRSPAPPEPRCCGSRSLEIDLDRRRVLFDGEPVRLTPMELALLELFVNEPRPPAEPRVPPRPSPGPDDDRQVSLRVHVRHLRQKLGDASAYPRLIGTEPGLGYRWLLDDGGVARPTELSVRTRNGRWASPTGRTPVCSGCVCRGAPDRTLAARGFAARSNR